MRNLALKKKVYKRPIRKNLFKLEKNTDYGPGVQALDPTEEDIKIEKNKILSELKVGTPMQFYLMLLGIVKARLNFG